MKLLHSLVVINLLMVCSLNAQTEAGKTMVARGDVNAFSELSNNDRKLKRRSLIYSDDTVRTGDNAKAQLRMTDGGMIALKENSELLITDYEFSEANGRGTAVMELVKGGLRSVTGAIKAESGDYRLKTPVGSIGIRGTHYEVEIVGSTIWVAVWDGAVDLDITTGDAAGSTLSLGGGEGYSYASIEEGGKVTTFVEPPETFESGMTTDADEVEQTDNEDEETQETAQSTESSSSVVATSSVAVTVTTEEDSKVQQAEEGATTEAISESSQDVAIIEEEQNPANFDDGSFLATDEFNTVATTSLADELAQRTGSFTYNQLSDVIVTSTLGEVSNFQINMTIDFDEATIPGGDMSFNDGGGEWFATFDGAITSEDINLDVTYASHGNNLAEGEVNASFLGNTETILGSFDLNEKENPTIRTNGSFRLK